MVKGRTSPMVKNHDVAIFYTTAVCNLRCNYCYIDKNEALVEIDKILDESFKGDYYINFVKKMFPDKNQLHSVETWGGEPFLRMDRIHHTLREIIKEYPNFTNMMSSTNFSFPEWSDQFFGLMNVFGEFPNRTFNYSLQMSLDGTEEINDTNRGKGTTQKCRANFEKLVEGIANGRLPRNVTLTAYFKPTLDTNSLKLLNTKEKIIEYYQYLEEWISYFRDNTIGVHNAFFNPSVPNTASPSPFTIEDGKYFAQLCRMTREIERDNRIDHYFKYYQDITIYSNGSCGCCNNTCADMHCQGNKCGTGFNVIGLLPFDMISACHSGFTDLISLYKNKIVNKSHDSSTLDFKLFIEDQKNSLFTQTIDENRIYENYMDYAYIDGTTARTAPLMNSIILLALSGQIEKKYSNYREAQDAAEFILTHTAFCSRDNYASTGSVTLVPIGIIRLLLNGAKEYINNEITV